MTDEEYQAGLQSLRDEWGGLTQDRNSPGILRADLDQTTGFVVGRRAALIAEIINRAIKEVP